MLVRRAESLPGTVGRVEAGHGPTSWAPELSDAKFASEAKALLGRRRFQQRSVQGPSFGAALVLSEGQRAQEGSGREGDRPGALALVRDRRPCQARAARHAPIDAPAARKPNP